MNKIALAIAILLLVGVAFYQYQTRGNNLVGTPEKEEEILAIDLNTPWELAFLPDSGILIAQRPGNIKLVKGNNTKTITSINGVEHVGEGGLLGLALHPKFENNHFVYLYYTYSSNGKIRNQVARYKYDNEQLVRDKTILENIPGAKFHNGGRVKFGPDGKLYITTGDAQNKPSSQDLSSLAGKILRLNDDGSVPSDNPFNSPVYSYGHRNPQGLAWDGGGRLWITEHGESAYDEINIIEAGKNYGWPDYRADQAGEGVEPPYIHSGKDTWAPSGAQIKGDTFYFSGLRGKAIYSLDIKPDYTLKVQPPKKVKAHLEDKYGRMRIITLGPDGYFYILTNNTDGRGIPKKDDDKLIKLHPSALSTLSTLSTFSVSRVIDGDTIQLETGQTVRYIGIDTPETVHPAKPVECFGKEAADKNKELVLGKNVQLEKDVSETDKYGRLLRYVWVGETLVNDNLVRNGFAKSSSYPPDIKYQTQLMEAEREARKNNRGLWSSNTCGKP